MKDDAIAQLSDQVMGLTARMQKQSYKFSSWSGLADSSTDNPIHFTAYNYGTLTANFQQSLSVEQYLAIILGPISVVSIVVSWLFRNRQRDI
jgi:hypothetical protein